MKLISSNKVKKAVILAGGIGSRFLPSTLAIAKELVSVGNKPILLYHLEDLAKAGITDVLIVGNKLKKASFLNFLNPPKKYLEQLEKDGKLGLIAEYQKLMKSLKISYVNQDDSSATFDGKVYKNELSKRYGSSIAIYAARGWAGDDPFLVINGDDLCLYRDGRSVAAELIDVFNTNGDYVMYGKEVDRSQIYKYSSMVIGEKVGERAAKMLDIVEKPEKGTEPSNIMGFARYIYTSDVFDRIKKSKPRKNGEYCIVDVFSDVAKEGRASVCIFDGDYLDCGSIAGYALANLYVGLSDESCSKVVREGAEKLLKDFKK